MIAMMETLDEFEAKTILAFDLQPQEGLYAFLPGKGWGTEIAIQYPVYKKTDAGYVERKKDPVCFQARGYRSHSDFEMYGMQRRLVRDHYTPKFLKEFGCQEYFETTKLAEKGVEDISREELWNNTEITVLPNGKEITTLSLEYLLVEKLIENSKFEQPNNHGRDISDAGALALVYEDIDREKVKEIYTQNYINNIVKRLTAKKDQSDEEYLMNCFRGGKTVEEFIMAQSSSDGFEIPSRYDEMIEKMEDTRNWKFDNLQMFAMYCNVHLLKESDYEPLLAIHKNPQSWVDGKLTEEAKNAVKEAMIKSTQENLDNREQDLQVQIDEVKGFITNIDSFFQAVDQRKKEIKQAEEIKDISQPKQESCDRLRKVLEEKQR